MLNPILWRKVQGQKHPGRWGVVEHQIPSIKVLFKTNTNGHKHPSIRLLSKSKTQLINQSKQKVAFSPGTAHSPEIQSYRTWWGAASPILNDTPVVYTSYNRTQIRNAHTHTHTHTYIYIYNTELLGGNQGHQEETHRPTHRFRRLFLDLFSMLRFTLNDASPVKNLQIPRHRSTTICSPIGVSLRECGLNISSRFPSNKLPFHPCYIQHMIHCTYPKMVKRIQGMLVNSEKDTFLYAKKP